MAAGIIIIHMGISVYVHAQPLAELLEGVLPLLNGVKNNRQQWQSLADNPGFNVL